MAVVTLDLRRGHSPPELCRAGQGVLTGGNDDTDAFHQRRPRARRVRRAAAILQRPGEGQPHRLGVCEPDQRAGSDRHRCRRQDVDARSDRRPRAYHRAVADAEEHCLSRRRNRHRLGELPAQLPDGRLHDHPRGRRRRSCDRPAARRGAHHRAATVLFREGADPDRRRRRFPDARRGDRSLRPCRAVLEHVGDRRRHRRGAQGRPRRAAQGRHADQAVRVGRRGVPRRGPCDTL